MVASIKDYRRVKKCSYWMGKFKISSIFNFNQHFWLGVSDSLIRSLEIYKNISISI